MIKTILWLLFSVGVCFFAGGIGSYFTYPSIRGWYAQLNKPFFNPPNWVFGPVWSLLYLLMGISLFLVIVNKKKKKGAAYNLFFAQLILNSFWSIVFFGLQNPPLAFLLIIFLWLAIFFTIRSFAKIDKRAAWILYPYIAWVSFASLLNISVAILNR